jgi:hypothetical protein
MVLSYIGHLSDNSPAGGAASNLGASATPTQTQPVWEYSAETDKMGRGTTKYASLKSVNEVSFDFPYNGGSRGILMLRNSPKYGRDAVLEITKGSEAADGSSNVIFLPYSTVLRDARRAKVLRFEANFYQEGSRVLEFHTRGLEVKELSRK